MIKNGMIKEGSEKAKEAEEEEELVKSAFKREQKTPSPCQAATREV